MTRLAFVVPGPPVASERVKKVPIRKRDGKLGLRAWTPPKSAEYMDRVEAFARAALQRHPGWRAVAEQAEAFLVQLHFVRPKWLGDWDNMAKTPCDAMQKAGVFGNDNRVIQALVSVHTDPKAVHRTEIVVQPAIKLAGPLWQSIAIAEGWRPKGEPTCAKE